jgi:hypothetical protein
MLLSSTYGLHLERRVFNEILYEADNSDYLTIITTVSFIALLVKWYSNILLPVLRQFFVITNRINKFMDLRK